MTIKTYVPQILRGRIKCSENAASCIVLVGMLTGCTFQDLWTTTRKLSIVIVHKNQQLIQESDSHNGSNDMTQTSNRPPRIKQGYIDQFARELLASQELLPSNV